MTRTAKLFHPSTIILVAANLVPLFGIFLWGWDAFLLLVLYWMETAIIGFWTILAIAIAPHQTLGPSAKETSRWFLVPFFIVHSGIFMGVHFLFLWSLFSGDWAARIHGPIEFVRIIVIGAGLWVPLVALFISRGVSSLLLVIGPIILPSWLTAKPAPATATDTNPFSEQRLLGGFYTRIIVMHLTLIVGGGIAVALGSVGALVLMIALKIAVDLKLHLKNDFPSATPVAVTTV
jgi:Family of unknown function (DUF6498)